MDFMGHNLAAARKCFVTHSSKAVCWRLAQTILSNFWSRKTHSFLYILFLLVFFLFPVLFIFASVCFLSFRSLVKKKLLVFCYSSACFCFPLKVKQHETFVCKMSASFGSGSLHTGYFTL